MKFTKSEQLIKNVALIYALVFFVAVLVFIFLPSQLFYAVNVISVEFFTSLPWAEDLGKFWLSMTVSMMFTIITCSLYIFKDPKKYYTMAIPLVVAKFTSSIFGAGFFVLGFFYVETAWNNLANLVICITDLPLGIFMLYLYFQVKYQKNK